MWKDKLFWFAQPATILNNYDKYLLWLFAAMVGAGILSQVVSKFSRHQINKKLFGKFGNLSIWMGIVGLLWFALRYENTPVFAFRFWAGLILVISLVWLAVVLKYLFTKFFLEKREYDKVQLNSRYIPGSKQ